MQSFRWFLPFPEFNSVDWIMVIPRRQHKFNRVPQPIHDCSQLCIQHASGSSNCLICRFFLHWLFHKPWCRLNPNSGFPYPHLRTMHEIWRPLCRHPATVLRCGRSKASLWVCFDHLSEVTLASPPFPAATVLLYTPIVLLPIHTVSYLYFCTNPQFVQCLFFEQDLGSVHTNKDML